MTKIVKKIFVFLLFIVALNSAFINLCYADDMEEDNYDSGDADDDDDYVDPNEDLKDLVVVDEEELENE